MRFRPFLRVEPDNYKCSAVSPPAWYAGSEELTLEFSPAAPSFDCFFVKDSVRETLFERAFSLLQGLFPNPLR